MRVLSNSLMAAVVVAALFLGNCLSCPQVLAAMAAHTPSHDCCHHKTHHSTVKTDCQSQALQHFMQSEKTASPAPAVMALVALPAPAVSLQPSLEWSDAPAPTPPDLVSLNSSFRI
jgi:hypothetical protein